MRGVVVVCVFVAVMGCGRPNPGFPIPKWTCQSFPAGPPAKDVWHLTPHDIKVVMSLGDSISAGFGMYSDHLEDILRLVEFRGKTFQSGGDETDCNGHEVLSLPNFIKKYNKDVQGASHGDSLPLDAIKWKNGDLQPFDESVTHLNAAQSMAKIDALPGQVSYLVQQLKTTYAKTVNFEKDWKMLTILIGANNLCGACKGRDYADPDYFGNQLDIILTQVNKTLPRTFVNVVALFNISNVYNVAKKSAYCMFMWKDVAASECMCMQGSATDNDRRVMDEHSLLFNDRIYKVVNKWRALNYTEFGVVVQPMLTGMIPISLDFISEFDCFHPSGWADGAFAIGLWNNLLQSPANKNRGINPANMKEILCPTATTYFQ